jgi:hypothetical protein
MINRRFDDRAPCLAWMSPKQALAGKPRIHSPASGIGGHESGSALTNDSSGLADMRVWLDEKRH